MIFFSGIVEGRIKLHRDISVSPHSVKCSTVKPLFDVSLLTFVSSPCTVPACNPNDFRTPFSGRPSPILNPSAINMKADTNISALNLIASKRPLVIGHRGSCQVAPENTLPSFKLAMAAGADLVELDYHHTKDGKLVVIHDSELDRTTDATNRWRQKRTKVASRTAAEIQSLDAGSWFDGKYAGTKIPLLAEALDTIQQGSITLIERKDGDPGACIKLLHNKDLINKVVVQAFDWEYLREFHEQEPDQILGALGPPSLLPDGKK